MNSPPELERLVLDLQAWSPALRITPSAQRHITMKFLGEVDETLLPQLNHVGTIISEAIPHKPMNLRGLGLFPHRHHPRIIWVGVQDEGILLSAMERLDDLCTSLGFKSESHPYIPHVTLARIKQHLPGNFFDWLRLHQRDCLGQITLEQIVLCESQLRPSGPLYIPQLIIPIRT